MAGARDAAREASRGDSPWLPARAMDEERERLGPLTLSPGAMFFFRLSNRAGMEPRWISLLSLGFLLSLLAAAAVISAASQGSSRPRAARWMAILAPLAVSGILAFGAGTARVAYMSPHALAWVFLACLAIAIRRGRSAWAGFFLGGATALHPAFFLFTPAFFAWAAGRQGGERVFPAKAFLAFLAPLAAVWAPLGAQFGAAAAGAILEPLGLVSRPPELAGLAGQPALTHLLRLTGIYPLAPVLLVFLILGSARQLWLASSPEREDFLLRCLGAVALFGALIAPRPEGFGLVSALVLFAFARFPDSSGKAAHGREFPFARIAVFAASLFTLFTAFAALSLYRMEGKPYIAPVRVREQEPPAGLPAPETQSMRLARPAPSEIREVRAAAALPTLLRRDSVLRISLSAESYASTSENARDALTLEFNGETVWAGALPAGRFQRKIEFPVRAEERLTGCDTFVARAGPLPLPPEPSLFPSSASRPAAKLPRHRLPELRIESIEWVR